MALRIKNILFFSLIFVPYIHMIGYESFPTWRFFNIVFVICCFIVITKIKTFEIPFEFMFLFGLFVLWIMFQFAYVLADDRFGFYEPFYLLSLLFLIFYAFFLHVLLFREKDRVFKTLELSIVIMIAYQIFQFFAFLLGYPRLCLILNQFNLEKIAVFYKIVGSLLGPASFLSESGMFALLLGPTLSIFILFDHYGIYKFNKKLFMAMFLGIGLTLSGGAFLEFLFIGILFFALNLKRVSTSQYLMAVTFIIGSAILILNNPSYYELISIRVESLLTGRSGRFDGYHQIMEIYSNSNLLFGIGPKSGRYFVADQNMLLPMLLTDHGLIGTLILFLIFLLPYILAIQKKSNPLFLIPYTGFLIHLFLAYGTFMWSYLWMIYILVLFGVTYRTKLPLQKPDQYI